MPMTSSTLGAPLPALLYTPPSASEDAPLPLILFLHGSGERGRDLNRLRLHGLPRELEGGRDLPAYVVAPQCPEDVWWDAITGDLSALLDAVEARVRVDPDRVLVTGLSMGGYGTWALALREPRRFAALAPICGGGDPTRAAEIAHIPEWVFHGALDDVVPARNSEEMVAALRAAGGDVRFTLYPDLAHDSWTRAYGEQALYDWLLAQRRATG